MYVRNTTDRGLAFLRGGVGDVQGKPAKEGKKMYVSVHSRPGFAERARCTAARLVLELTFVLGRLTARLLPREHPARLYILAEIDRQKPNLTTSIVPSGGTTARRISGVATALIVWAVINGVAFSGDKGPADAIAALIQLI